MITLGLLKTELVQFLVNETIPARVPNWVYWVMTDILSSPQKFWWNKKKSSLTTVSGTAEYFLTHRVSGWDVIWMGDEARNGFEITKTDLERIYRHDSTPTDTGDPVVWAPVDLSSVQASNTATTASAVSTSTADLSVNVIIQGQSSGIDQYETISLNGTTTATATIPVTWTADTVHSVSLSAQCIGVVTVTIGNDIAVIPPGLQRIQCPRIRLWRVPGSTVLTLPYTYYAKAARPVNDGDMVDIPDFAFDALLKGLFYWGHKNNGETREAQSTWGEYLAAKQKLISFSQTEVTRKQQKEWNTSIRDVPYTIPRTITHTVT